MAFKHRCVGVGSRPYTAYALAVGLALSLLPLLAGQAGIGGVEVIIDNDDPGTSSKGNWTVLEIPGAWQDDLRIARPVDPGDEGKAYTYSATLSGQYELHLWWFGSPLLSSAVTVTVKHDGGTASEVVNQQENGSQWNLLGSYQFTGGAEVTINAASDRRTAADAVRFVPVLNEPPVATIDSIAPNSATAGTAVLFEGSGTDPDGSVIAHLWTSDMDGTISTSEDFSKNDLSVGSHNIEYSVQDDDLEWSATVSQNIVIDPLNQPPTATIVSIAPNPAEVGATVNFDGSSNDSDGNVIAYLWTSDADGTISSSEDFSKNDLSVGPHNIEYSVQDDDLEWSAAVSLNLLIEPPNQPPVATIESVFPNPANVGTTVSFNGSSSDPDGVVVEYRWESNWDGVISTAEDFARDDLSINDHTILFLVRDDDQEWSPAAVLVLSIEPEPNELPTATITSISPNPSTEGNDVAFAGTGDDPDGQITAYHWESDIDGILANLPTFSILSLAVGPHQITFRVQDDNLDWSPDATAVVNVNPIPNQLPAAQINNVSPNPAEEGATVTFAGSGIDPDGSIVGYRWQSDLVAGDLSTAAVFSTATLPVGIHGISFEVQDDDLEWSPPQTQSLEIHPPANTEIILVSPGIGSLLEPFGVNLEVQVDDPEGQTIELEFHGRLAGSDEEFTVIAIPDTQNYVEVPALAPIFTVQTQWIVDNIEAENIVFVTHEGDVVDHADSLQEWQFSDESMNLLDAVVPFGISPGNHDTDLHLNLPPGVTGTLYHDFFPLSRFENFPWYGGSFPLGTNWNSFQLFSASGVDFVIVHLQFCPNEAEVAWADAVLDAHADRKAIITTHGYIDKLGNRAVNLCEDTQYIWDDLVVPNDNVFFVLCGHQKTEFLRTDTVGNRQVHQMLANYQSEPNGSDGWLRLLRFVPAEDTVHVTTYSPWLDDFRAGSAASFSLGFPMRSFATVGTVAGVASGSTVAASWSGLSGNTQYEWFVTATDENGGQMQSPIWTFTTTAGIPEASIISVTPNPAQIGAEIAFDGEASDPGGTINTYLWESDVDGVLSNEPDFSTTSLSLANHTISFSVEDNEQNWSDVMTIGLLVEDPIVPTPPTNQFRRGDSNRDSAVDLSDGSFILNFLFIGGMAPPCRDAADTDDSGELDISDGINVFLFLFGGGDSPPTPGPFECGSDPTDDIAELTCEGETSCQ